MSPIFRILFFPFSLLFLIQSLPTSLSAAEMEEDDPMKASWKRLKTVFRETKKEIKEEVAAVRKEQREFQNSWDTLRGSMEIFGNELRTARFQRAAEKPSSPFTETTTRLLPERGPRRELRYQAILKSRESGISDTLRLEKILRLLRRLE